MTQVGHRGTEFLTVIIIYYYLTYELILHLCQLFTDYSTKKSKVFDSSRAQNFTCEFKYVQITLTDWFILS